jgi:hypothetical protein
VRRVYEESGGGKEPAMGYIVGWLSADKNDGKAKERTSHASWTFFFNEPLNHWTGSDRHGTVAHGARRCG